eukprot:4403118-Pleurochrysis_carterae.AAC.1
MRCIGYEPSRRWSRTTSRRTTAALRRCRSRSWGRALRAPSCPGHEARRRRGTLRARGGALRLRPQSVMRSSRRRRELWLPALLVKSASPTAASDALASEARAALPTCLSRESVA